MDEELERSMPDNNDSEDSEVINTKPGSRGLSWIIATPLWILILVLMINWIDNKGWFDAGERIDQEKTTSESNAIQTVESRLALMSEDIRSIEKRIKDEQSKENQLEEKFETLIKECTAYPLLVETNRALEEELAHAKSMLKDAQDGEKKAKKNLLNQMEVSARQRQKMAEREKLLDKTLSEAEKIIADGGVQKAEPVQSEKSPDQKVRADLLASLNQLFSKYLDEGLRVVDCEKVDGNCLWKPIIHMDSFLGEASIVLIPERVVCSANNFDVSVFCFGGSYSNSDGHSTDLPSSGIRIAQFTPQLDEKWLTPSIVSLLCLPDPADAEKYKYGDLSSAEGVLNALNDLLYKERAGKYRFNAIEGLNGTELVNVELAVMEPSGKLIHVVKAKTCGVDLMTRDNYIEFHFRDGGIVADDKHKPFYNNHYRLPIPNIKPDLWVAAGLDCVSLTPEKVEMDAEKEGDIKQESP